MNPNEPRSILDGIKVLDISRIVAGPLCTQSLADMGATVYKVERPHVGDDMRHIPQTLTLPDGTPSGDSTAYLSVNRGKHSISLDISRPQGQKIVRELAAKCDVFVENYKGGNLARYGLDYDNIKRVNPGIVYCSISGFGQDGPLASQPGYDPIFQAISGIMSTCGHPVDEPNGGPVRSTIPFIDVMTGMTATTAILGALYHRKNGGEGQFLDIALLDVALAAAAVPYGQTYLSTGNSPKLIGNKSALFSPSNCYPCAGGGFILIQVGNEAQWKRMCAVLQRPDWLSDPRFVTNKERMLNIVELHRQLTEMTRARDAQELAQALGDADVPCGPVNSFAQAFDSPQVKHRGIRMELNDPVRGPMPYVRSPLRFSATPLRYRPAPALGADTVAVLQAELGLDDQAIARLKADKLI